MHIIPQQQDFLLLMSFWISSAPSLMPRLSLLMSISFFSIFSMMFSATRWNTESTFLDDLAEHSMYSRWNLRANS